MDAAATAHLRAPGRLEFTQLPFRGCADWMYWTIDLYDSAQGMQIYSDSTHKSYPLLSNSGMCLPAREVGYQYQ
ncbi:hypothetical protein Aduo_014602 [Ancylostoma duodenale]